VARRGTANTRLFNYFHHVNCYQMTENNCFHNELKRTVDDTIGGEMVYRCVSNHCFGIFAVRALDFPDATKTHRAHSQDNTAPDGPSAITARDEWARSKED
jgi:hypothetical protein